jgi:inner membrane protein
MDFSNTYGVRPWLPFSAKWYSWDICFIVDPWIWAALLLGVTIPALGRLISSEIGETPRTGSAAAILSLLFILSWWGVRDVMHRRAVAMLGERLYGSAQGGDDSSQTADRRAPQAALRVAAFSEPLSPLSWRGLAETEGFYQIIQVDVRRPLNPSSGRILYKPEQTAALAAALQSRTAVEFSSFARYRYAKVDRSDDGYRVFLTDLRFEGERPNAFQCVIDLDRDLKITNQRFSF